MSGRMRWLVAAGLAALSAGVVAQDAPKSAPPAPTAAPAPTPAPGSPGPAVTSVPVIQPLPTGSSRRGGGGGGGSSAPRGPAVPPIEDIIDPKLLEELVEASRPKYDIPPAARRSLDEVGVLAESEGGLVAAPTGRVTAPYARLVIDGIEGPLVSRWGHILLRRALSSRLATPAGMEGGDWAALRARALLRLGEADAARLLVQEVDSGDYTRTLEDAALDAYVATGDLVGVCPVVAITAARREGDRWELSRGICEAFTNEGSAGMVQLDRALRRGVGERVDVLLAQKFAGAAGTSRRAVNIEWDNVDQITPWRFGLALAVGLEPPDRLMNGASPVYDLFAARAPMLPLTSRAAVADRAAGRGVLSSAAMVDLYSQIYALGEQESSGDGDNAWVTRAARLRTAYVAADPAARMRAIRELWSGEASADAGYGARVLTAYAAARMPPAEAFAEEADALVGSMLTAGLDRNAARWASVVPAGSRGWALVTLASPEQSQAVSRGTVDGFVDGDDSDRKLRSRLLVAGLYGLGRLSEGDARAIGEDIGVNFARRTRWTRAIEAAAEQGNQPMVAFLAGLGMQGDGWGRMTALHLYHITAALRRVGLDAEARMIAAEGVARA